MKATDIGLILLVVFLVAVYRWGKKPVKPATRTQDLVSYLSVSPDGIIELPGRRFAMVLEVQAMPFYLKSGYEQAALWLAFRRLIDSLTVPATFLVQTRHVDLRGYLADLARAAEGAATPELAAYGRRFVSWLRTLAEERRVREFRHYIILRVDVSDLGDFASGLTPVEEALEALGRVVSRGASSALSDADARDLARQELENQAVVLIQQLSAMGLRCVPSSVRPGEPQVDRPLNRQEVLDLLHAYFNRDLADAVAVRDADEMRAFLDVPLSATLFMEEAVAGVPEDEERSRAAGA
jgi:hypothetical protein